MGVVGLSNTFHGRPGAFQDVLKPSKYCYTHTPIPRPPQRLPRAFQGRSRTFQNSQGRYMALQDLVFQDLALAPRGVPRPSNTSEGLPTVFQNLQHGFQSLPGVQGLPRQGLPEAFMPSLSKAPKNAQGPPPNSSNGFQAFAGCCPMASQGFHGSPDTFQRLPKTVQGFPNAFPDRSGASNVAWRVAQVPTGFQGLPPPAALGQGHGPCAVAVGHGRRPWATGGSPCRSP